ncbi:hypothetical protein CN500_20635 [Bacillus cereus]|nr:hypothetical protein CN500_20635 [Bacillus cereus]
MLKKETYDSIDVSDIGWTNEQYCSLGLLLDDIYKRNPSILREEIELGKTSNGAGRPFAYSHEQQRFTYNPDWMDSIEDTAKLSEISIPGTHDTMSRGPGGDLAQTQSMSLRTQLESGIRFIDIRCRYIDGSFAIHHGMVYLNANFNDVLEIATKFLRKNPSETILMRVKQEYSDASDQVFNETLKKYMDRFPTFFWDSKNGSIDNPTLGEMRGKIVILRDVGGSNIGLSYSYDFDTQDKFGVYSNWGLYDKWEHVKDHLRKAQQAYPNKGGKPLVNYLSGSTDEDKWWFPVFPYFVASGHSSPGNSAPRLSTGLTTPGWSRSYPDFPRTTCFLGICTISFEGTNILATNYIKENKLDYTGIVVSDFPGPDLINAVIRVNQRLKKSRIPNGTYRIVTALDTSNGEHRVVDLNRENQNITLWKGNDGDNQKWEFVYDEDREAYQIRSVSNPDLVLVWIDVSSAPTYKNVMGHKNEHKEEHYWILEKLKDRHYIIKSKKDLGLVLDVDGAKDANGTKIKVEKRHHGNEAANPGLFNAQKFKIETI